MAKLKEKKDQEKEEKERLRKEKEEESKKVNFVSFKMSKASGTPVIWPSLV